MSIIEETAQIVSNEQVDSKLFILGLKAPLIAQTALPGQFVHLGIPGIEAHILRRPFSLYSAAPKTGIVEILYQTVGFGTARMGKLASHDTVSLLGPVGNPWSPPLEAKSVLLVGGGVGAAPLYLLADKLASAGAHIDVIMGAQTESSLVCHSRYQELLAHKATAASALHCATDDGSFGHAGFCTSLVEEALGSKAYDYAAVCGPEGMMRVVSSLILEAGIPCELSFERRMACGIGACLSCVVETVDGLKRACVDGPVFDARKVVFA